MGEVAINRRGSWFPCLIVFFAVLCVGGFLYLNMTSLFLYGILGHVFGWVCTYGVFCILFETATLITARKMRIPEQQDRWKQVSYWFTVSLTVVFPAVLAVYLLRDYMNFPALFFGLSCSYMVCAILWLPILARYGYTGTANFAEVAQKPRYKAENLMIQRAYKRNYQRSNNEAKRKAASGWVPNYDKVNVDRTQHKEWKQKDYGSNTGIQITDQDWYDKH